MFHMEQSNAVSVASERWYNMNTIVSISHVKQYHNGVKLGKIIDGTITRIIPVEYLQQIGEHYLIVYDSGFTNVFTSYADLPKTAKNIVRGREWEKYSHKMNETHGTKYTTITSTYERIESL